MSGFGLGFRPPLYRDIIETKPHLDFVEIISENFMGVGGNARKRLEQVRGLYPVAMHGVSLSIGSEDDLDFEYLKELKKLSDWLDPFIVSDHICFTKNSSSRQFYDLLPISYHGKSLDHLVSRVQRVQELLGRSILLENPSAYLSWHNSDRSEVDFLKELCKRAGCGLLLDLNNLVVNQNNLGLNPLKYIDELDTEVRQFHIAGHKIADGIRIDTHDEAVSEDVWSLLEVAKGKWPDVPVLLERDDHIPTLSDLMAEVDFARRLIAKPLSSQNHKSEIGPDRMSPNFSSVKQPSVEPLTIELLNEEATEPAFLEEHFRSDLPSSPMVGVATYKFAYRERIESALKETFKCLYYIAEEEGFKAIVGHYLTHCPPSHWSLNLVGDGMAKTLRAFDLDFDFGVPRELIAEIADLDQMQIECFLGPDSIPLEAGQLKSFSPEEFETLRVVLSPSSRFVKQQWNLSSLVDEVAQSLPPTLPENSETFLGITRRNFHPMVSSLTQSQFELIEIIRVEPGFQKIIDENLDRLADFVALCEIGAISIKD